MLVMTLFGLICCEFIYDWFRMPKLFLVVFMLGIVMMAVAMLVL